MDTQTSQMPEPDGGSSFLQDVEQPSGSMVTAIIYGLATALLGGMVWALIVIVANYELGILAWAIGGFVGGVMVWAKKKGSSELAVAAVIISLIGLASGKMLSYEFGTVPEVQSTFEADKSNHDYYVFMHLQGSGKYSQPLLDWLTSDDSSEEPPDALQAEFLKFQAEAEALSTGQDQTYLKEEAAIHARSALASLPFSDRYDLGAFDLLWIFLAVGTAWRLGMGQSQPEPQRVRRSRTRVSNAGEGEESGPTDPE